MKIVSYYSKDYTEGALPENIVSVNNGEDILVFRENKNGECSIGHHNWCGGLD